MLGDPTIEEQQVLGAIPYQTFLSSPTLAYLVDEMQAEIIHEGSSLNQPLSHVFVADFDSSKFLATFRETNSNTLAIIDTTRSDLMLCAAACSLALNMDHISFLITGSMALSKDVLDILRATSISILGVKRPTYELTQKLHDLTVKLVETDKQKLSGVVDLVGKHVNFEMIQDAIQLIEGKPSNTKRLWLKTCWFFGIICIPFRRAFFFLKKWLSG
jgi:BioD-like phosphotransacetylase family protein